MGRQHGEDGAARGTAWRRARTWLLAAAFVVAPLGGLLLVLLAAGRLALARRSRAPARRHR